MSGLFIVFEGSDGSGKTSTMQAVNDELKKRAHQLPPIHLTNHPGSTPLGKHIRVLVKTPELINPDIVVDDLSRQTLYMVDTISFVSSILRPAIENNEIVFADRSSFISAMIYGLADGLNLIDIERLFSLITPPRMNRLYILRCPWELAKKRVCSSRALPDHYDKKGSEFYQKVCGLYDGLLTSKPEQLALVSRSVNLDDIQYYDSTMPQSMIVDQIVDDLLPLIKEATTD